MSFTKVEEVTNCSLLGISTTVSSSGARSRLAWAMSNSNSKSLNFRRPRIRAVAPRERANSAVRPSSAATSTPGMPARASRAMASRSSSVNQGFLASLAAMARITRSKSRPARRTTSTCPRVSGSKVPG